MGGGGVRVALDKWTWKITRIAQMTPKRPSRRHFSPHDRRGIREVRMRRALLRLVLVALLAAPAAGCLSTIEGAYDDHARDECDQSTRGTARSDCYDSVERNRRDRDN
jgi:hypothetical protein